MTVESLNGIEWYNDPQAKANGEPGITHSYMASLATALNFIDGDLDPVRLMGSSAFAFRIFINEVFCPSAMSVFDWNSILPEAIEQAGRQCVYISRLWHEEEHEEQRRHEAREAIVEGVKHGIPAIVWDVSGAEWGLVIGYDENKQTYDTLTYQGDCSILPFGKLGQNGIDILSVAIPGNPNLRNREEIILNSLRTAVAHAEQKEWMERPKYQDGLPAFDLWATLFNRWATLVDAGKEDNIPLDVPFFAHYYASHYYSARRYAKDYLQTIAGSNDALQQAASAYEKTALKLKPVWEFFSKKESRTPEALIGLADRIREAKSTETDAIEQIKQYLKGVE